MDGTPQSAGTIDAIQLWTGGIVAGFMLISLAIMALYPLTEKLFREIVADITARRARIGDAAEVEPLVES